VSAPTADGESDRLHRPPEPAFDLSTCEREPIHVPGHIQPHGCLLSIDLDPGRSDMPIVRASANSGRFLGGSVDDLIDRPAAEVLPWDLGISVNIKGSAPIEPYLPDPIELPAPDGGPPFQAIAHRSNGELILELTLAGPETADGQPVARGMMPDVSNIIGAPDVATLCDEAVRATRELTGYDRVMFYRFDTDWSGEVVSEAMADLPVSFLGLHFPASDIPAQARALYHRNIVRVLGDVNRSPVPIQAPARLADRPLDLSFAHLRSVSPVHVQYLRNMGVAATMSLSILVQGRLWGLIACHHYAPRVLSPNMLGRCRQMAWTVAMRLEVLLQMQDLAEREAAGRIAMDLRDRTGPVAWSADTGLAADLSAVWPDLSNLLDVTGAVGWFDDAWIRLGDASLPDDGQHFGRLIESMTQASGEGRSGIGHTDCLASVAGGTGLQESAGGLLLSGLDAEAAWVLFTRPERARTVRWAGDPTKPAVKGPDGSDRLMPRSSFEAWTETVAGRSKPFARSDLQAAQIVREALVERLAVQRNRRVEAENHRLRTAVEASHSGIATVQQVGGRPVFAYGNAAFRRITGQGDPPSPSLALADIVGPESDPETVRAMIQAVESGAPITVELRCYRASDKPFWAVLSLSPVRDPTGELLESIAVLTDISAQRDQEAQLRHAQKLQALGQMTGGISHDFNNILTGTLLNLTLARDDIDVPATRELLQDSIDSIRKAQSLTQRLLAFSRRQSLKPERVDAREVVRGAVDILHRTLGANIDLSMQLSGSPEIVKIDPIQLEAALLNLAFNARDAMPHGGPLTIAVDRARIGATVPAVGDGQLTPGWYCRIAVSDGGTGIAPEYLERVIEPFFTTKEVGKGSGLGLSMVFGFVRQSNGNMTVESSVGEGTTFTLYLPLQTVPDSDLEDASRGPRILLVEDDDLVRRPIKVTLERAGFTVLEAASAPEALATLDKAGAVELILSDIVMPGAMNGVDMLRHLRDHGSTVPVVLMTGYDFNLLDNGANGDGETVMLHKPFEPEQLLETVRAATAAFHPN